MGPGPGHMGMGPGGPMGPGKTIVNALSNLIHYITSLTIWGCC